MKRFLKLMILLTGYFTLFLLNPGVPQSELIEPTRTLQGTNEGTGQLTVFSEPPGLPVKLNGKLIGQTPTRVQEINSGFYQLQVRESAVEIYIKPGKVFHISLFKDKFIKFQVAKKKSEKQPTAEKFPKSETWTPQPSPEEIRTKEQNRQAWERWMQFVNGSSKHF